MKKHLTFDYLPSFRSTREKDGLCSSLHSQLNRSEILSLVIEEKRIGCLGYVRLLLLGFCWFFFDHPSLFLPLYITQALLDGLSVVEPSSLSLSR